MDDVDSGYFAQLDLVLNDQYDSSINDIWSTREILIGSHHFLVQCKLKFQENQANMKMRMIIICIRIIGNWLILILLNILLLK